ncbi:MAG: response regulator transcription factor [Oscillospiraceae bacterium]|nr:response regulator transcription factor [Oscillospiraceae bacterium]
MTQILIADDEDRWRKITRNALEQEGYAILEAANGRQAVELLRVNPEISLLVLNASMSGTDGLDACREVRTFSQLPVLMIADCEDEDQEIRGMQVGADQFICKPVKIRAFVERVKSLLRRSGRSPERLVFGSVELDPVGENVRIEDHLVRLTPKEFELLLYLARTPNLVRSREQILQAVWHAEHGGELRAVDTHIKNLRLKLGACGEMVATVRGQGYVLRVPAVPGSGR